MNLVSSMPLAFSHNDLTYVAQTAPEARAAGVPEEVVLAAIKTALKSAVDARAGALRGAVLSTGAGQEMEYQETQAQAAAALKAPSSATAEKYPMLAATIGIDLDPETGKPAKDILGVARSVQAARDTWLAIGSTVRGVRLKAKAAIDAAATDEAAQAAYDAIEWPGLPG